MRPIYGPGLYVDARTAYIFRCGDTELFAVSLDKAGANLPVDQCQQGWVLQTEFQLGVQESVPVPIEPEPILRGIEARGYYVWSNANTSKAHGTSQ